jgi:hypothetical protein
MLLSIATDISRLHVGPIRANLLTVRNIRESGMIVMTGSVGLLALMRTGQGRAAPRVGAAPANDRAQAPSRNSRQAGLSVSST